MKVKTNKLPTPYYIKLYAIYSTKTGFKESWNIQKQAKLSSGLILLALLLVISCFIYDDQLQNWLKILFIIGSGILSYTSYIVRDDWIKKSNLDVNSYKDWLAKQKIDAYYEAKDQDLFKSIDVEKDSAKPFEKDVSFWKSKTNMIVVAIFMPVWSVFLSNLEEEQATYTLVVIFVIGLIVMYFNFLFHAVLSSNKIGYKLWLQSCVEQGSIEKK